jgi:hypothetical protein
MVPLFGARRAENFCLVLPGHCGWFPDVVCLDKSLGPVGGGKIIHQNIVY